MSVPVCFKYKIVFEDKEGLKEALDFFDNLDVIKSFPGKLGRNEMSSVVRWFLPSQKCVNEDFYTIEYYDNQDLSHPESDSVFHNLLKLLVKKKINLSFEARTQTIYPDDAYYSEENYYKCKNGELQQYADLSKIPYDDPFFIIDEPVCDVEELTVAITGKLKYFDDRDDFASFFEEFRGKVASSVTKKVDFLITNNPDSNSSKIKKAKELGVEIISEKDFLCKYDLDQYIFIDEDEE